MQSANESSGLNGFVRKLFPKEICVELIEINKEENIPYECPCETCDPV